MTTARERPTEDEPPRRRDPVRTREALLSGAIRAVIQHGAGVSLEVIAREAGVSKGGLLHHYGSKNELYVAVAEQQLAEFRAAVEAAVDPGDRAPGRLVRAYVRVSLHQLEAARVRDEATLMAALATIPEVVTRARADGESWRAAFAEDGLDPVRTSVITRAADGAAAAALFEGQHDQGEIDRLRDVLLELSREAGPLMG
ncbi:TetR/AcrR family transcriptional regulator [Nocardioides sp. SYSU DS0663]|uniref:TetR/AcrR family transcriptional regulator n=1 Tax=Nocardioides sp. SYSU DS0663 TaxID=3416445 RepID=UPI003F4B8833